MCKEEKSFAFHEVKIKLDSELSKGNVHQLSSLKARVSIRSN